MLKNILIGLGLKKVVVSSQTLRPWWNPKASYRQPSVFRVSGKIIKDPFRVLAHIKLYFDLKNAWVKWPQWIANGIFAISARSGFHKPSKTK